MSSDFRNDEEPCQSDYHSAFHLTSLSDNIPAQSNSNSTGNDTQLSVPQEFFYVKDIKFKNNDYRIVLQSVNGPCPIIAIVNVLILKNEITIDKTTYISAGDLCSLLANYILDKCNSSDKLHKEQYTIDSLDRFVQIQTGIDINVKFNSAEGFEYTQELALFDFLSIRLVHGWLYDPQDKLLLQLVSDLSYNQLVEKALTLQSSKNDEDVSNYVVLKDFLETAQLTVHGICEIINALHDEEVAVLFRNNHFSTISKQDSRLFLLVTDIGWKDETSVVWETLDSTTNCTSFVDGSFMPSEPGSSGGSCVGKGLVATKDEAHALGLTEDELKQQQELWKEAKMAAAGTASSNLTTEYTRSEESTASNRERRHQRNRSNSSCSIS